MNKTIFSFFFLFIFIGMNAQFINDKDKMISEKIKQANSQYTSISSSFEQTKHISIINENVLSDGTFHYNKPDQLVMIYDHPAGDLMLINRDQFVMVISGKQRKTTSKANSKMNGMKTILTACLQGDIDQLGADKVSCEETQQYYIITADINQKINKSNIKRVILSYNKNDLSLSVLKTEEPDGSYTTYTLKGKEFNNEIDKNVFIPPKK